ncbi:MAG: hypothetical protein L0Y76_03905, partial [Ignavibacteria bacterium]|nr:hypothetical protein [Ignavibacteria bacterium]
MIIRYYYLILTVVIILNIFWVVSTPILPFVDLPFRLAESVIFHHYNNPDYLFSEYYVIPSLLKSNIFHTVFCSLSIFGNPETANKIYYSIYIILMPVSSYIIIKKLNGNIFYSLLPVLFLLNHNVHWGFTGYTMSVPILIILFAVFHDYFVSGIMNRIFFIGFFFILIFYLHFQSALFALFAFAILNFVYLKKDKLRFFSGFLIAVPVVLLMVLSYSPDKDGNSTIMFLLEYYRNTFLFSLPERFQILLILDNFVLFNGTAGIIYSASITALIAVTLIISLMKISLREIYRKHKFIVLLLFLNFSCYLFLPDNINGQNIIYERYSVLVFLLL